MPICRVLNHPLKHLFTILKPHNPIHRFHLHHVNAHNLFDEVPQRDLYSLNSLLSWYLRKGDPLSTWVLFRHIHGTYTHVNAYTFTPVFGACAVLMESVCGRQVHGLVIKWGVDGGVVTGTAILDMYAKVGMMDEAVRLWHGMRDKDVVAWNALLSGFVRHGMAKAALCVFEEMGREGVGFSNASLCLVMKACTILKDLRLGMQVHGVIVVMGRDLIVLGTALIEFYSNVQLIDEAIKVYESLSSKQDEIMCNTFVSACLKNRRYEEAYSVMCSMVPNVVSLTSALASSSENADLWIGKQIHCVAIRFGFEKDTQFCNVLLNMYAKCGKVSTARLIFDGIPDRDVVSWTSMIDGYRSHGFGIDAVELFARMEEEAGDVSPNDVTFLAVLSACSHSGLVEQGRQCFASIKNKYGLSPGPQHYACYIDILGRVGYIDEAWSAYDHMINSGCKPTSAVWAALLNACGLNNDFRRGEIAAKKLLELDSNKPGINVLLSNFYAAIGKWEVADQLRRTMKDNGLCKDVGSSWVSVSDSSKQDAVAF